MDGMTESDVRAAAGGDRNAFARVIEGTQSVVTSIALAITGDVARSQDVAQDVYLAAWRGLPSLRAPEKFEAWLRRIVRNRARSARFARPRETALPRERADEPGQAHAHEIADERPGALDSLVDAEDARRLDEVIAALPLATRQVVVLFYRSGCSLTETARQLGVSEVVVKKRLSRAREKIRAEVLDSAGRAIVRSSPAGGLVALVLAALPAGPPVPASPFAGMPRGLALGASVAGAMATVAIVVAVVAWRPPSPPASSESAAVVAAAAIADPDAEAVVDADVAAKPDAPANDNSRTVPRPSGTAGAPAVAASSADEAAEPEEQPEDEAKQHLSGIFAAERYHFDTHERFSEDFVALDWFPGAETPTYVFGFCGGGPRSHTMAAGTTAPLSEEHAISVTKTLPLSDPCAVLASLGIDTAQFRADAKGFKAFAIGNIDDDPELDVWTITNGRQLDHVRRDRAPTAAK